METLARLRDDSKSPERERKYLQKRTAVKKEYETKDDGRYIIFYTFEEEEDNLEGTDGGEED